MIGDIISNYKILEKIGAGGMGIVYKAEDTRLKRTVALKFLPSDLTRSNEAKQRFLHEAQAAAALNHPNICAVFSIDTFEDQMFMVMEYIAGKNLRDVINAGAITFHQALHIAMQFAEGLQDAHEAGIIHRDIKPANIMVTNKDHVKIMDFGLAKLAGQIGITKIGTTLGTVAYMSPEQARGDEIDHRSDIWSFGVVLYEMLSGKRPFKGEYEQAVIYAILNEEPELLSEVRSEIPVSLERIVHKALAKEIHERYSQMREILLDLTKLEKDSQSEIAVKQPKIPLSVPGDHKNIIELERPLCVGREHELHQLESKIELALHGTGQIVFITGDAGSGKTTLIRAIDWQAQEKHEALIISGGKCDAHTGIGDPYLPFRDVLSLLTGDVESLLGAGAISKDHATRLWNLLPCSVQALLDVGSDLLDTFISAAALCNRAASYSSSGSSWLNRLRQFVDRKKTDKTAIQLQQSDLFEQFTKVLHTLSKQWPLVIILDDLQWADTGSISLLFHLSRRIEGSRILIIGAYRSSEVSLGRGGERHPLEPVVNELKGIFGDIEIALDKAEGREFIDAFIDTEANLLSRTFRDTLFRQTEGHPLFTVELLRWMREQGVLVKDKQDKWIEGPTLNWQLLPVKIDAVVGECISRLPENLKTIMMQASVEGEEFTAEIVASLQKIDVREMIRLLSTDLDKRYNLVTARGIERINGQKMSQYRFRHALFQKYLYGNLDEIERTYLHEEVGNLLEHLYGKNTGQIAVQLARHFREADMAEKAIGYMVQAAEQARNVYANEEAIEHFQQALQLIKRDHDKNSLRVLTVRIYEGLGDVQEILGQHDQAREAFQEALALIDKEDVIRQARLHQKTGKTFEVQRRYDEALKAYKMAESVLGITAVKPETEWWHEWIEIHTARIWLHYWQDQLDEMKKLAERLQPAIEKHGNPAHRAKFFFSLTLLAFRRDQYIISDETIIIARNALTASRESEDVNSISMSQFLLGFSLLWRGELDEAEMQLQEALRLTEQTGDVVLQSRCLTYLTILYRKRGDIDNVRAYIPRCEAVASSGDMIEYVAQAHANTAWLAWREGNIAKAYDHGCTALKIWEPVIQSGQASSYIQWTALWPLIHITVNQEKFSEAIEFVRSVLDKKQVPKVPDSVKTILEKTMQFWEEGRTKETQLLLKKALEMAKKLNYL